MRAYYVKVLRHMLSTAVLTGFFGRRNREPTDDREVVSIMRTYYVKVIRQMFSMAVLTGFLSGAN
jgi:hypothetical protein